MEKKEERKEEMAQDLPALSPAPRTRSYSLKDKLLMALIIIGVVALGLFVVNQFVEWRYNNLLLQAPCDICRELNPHVESCFIELENPNKNKFVYNLTFSDSLIQAD